MVHKEITEVAQQLASEEGAIGWQELAKAIRDDDMNVWLATD